MDLSVPLHFLSALAENNNRNWFDQNKQKYLAAKNEFVSLTEILIRGVYEFDPQIGILKPADCIFRIYRDIRFSNNKEPYKTNMGTFLAKGGARSRYSGYYFHLEPGGRSFAGGGLWMPQSEDLRGVRQEIFYNVEEFKQILNDTSFKRCFSGLSIIGDELKNAPQGFPKDWPDIGLLKFKNYTVGRSFQDHELVKDSAVGKIIEAFKSMQYLNSFLNRALDG